MMNEKKLTDCVKSELAIMLTPLLSAFYEPFDLLVHGHIFFEDTILLYFDRYCKSIFAGQMCEFADSGRKFKSNSSQNIVGCWSLKPSTKANEKAIEGQWTM